MDMEQEIKVIESQRKVADFHYPAKVLMESLYGEKWRTIKSKLNKIESPLESEYYMSGVKELAARAANLRATL